MVPCETILKRAKEENVDIIGLSGLITPSLDEMVHVAKEMQREGFNIPVMIGGATTSKAHAAVKIEPQYQNDVAIYVSDASRSVAVSTSLLSDTLKPKFVDDLRNEYVAVRERRKNRAAKTPLLTYKEAINRKQAIDWENYQPPVPTFTGTKTFVDYPLEELIDYIDWTPFFIAWDLAGKYPKILTDEKVGEAATNLFNDAQALLKKLIADKTLSARAAIGFWPANSLNDDDIELYSSEDRDKCFKTLHHLRQQTDKATKKPNFSLADFIATKESGKKDYIGGFIVTAGIGAEELAKAYEADQDDYNSIMVKALADRLAEAFAERMHERVRKEFWGYANNETLENQDLIKEQYKGIRPAPGYPACPDHTEKESLFSLLNGEENSGVTLTEHFAMLPAASVSGFYYSHPESSYFSVGKINRDQVASYAERKKWSLKETERWLSPNLGYEAD